MEGEIARVRRWESELFPARREGYFIGPFLAHYVDELVRDMGLPTARSGNPLAEHFAPFRSSRYRDLGDERRRARAAHPPAHAA